ncbi:MAG TPA: rhodanese-like domain-containing protein [bacterium]|nr:rhodanese-like domain-containing protein [bacterium]HPR89534.1 rhodanese-like domain-containing protein [bacterium]
MSRWLPAWALRQALLLLLAAGLTGLVANHLNPSGVALRPAGAAIAGIAAWEESERAEQPRPISLAQLQLLLGREAALLLDARSRDEYRAGHLPGAVSLPYENWNAEMAQVDQLPHDRWLVCYCDGGGCELSEHLGLELVGRGFKKVAVYRGGIEEWQQLHPLAQEASHE